ncbi:TadE/TadG family type IV pilus assembly protein [Thalassoroseus pseudoceratinae]|uniref:TadE/TadG family type IV pilus assembly protein n=1 Tax=Thalassoroseus pseudoceratinae TaxID=2713176 RepID=UPI00141FD2E9|nr:hypothetical protein [Thalassoroseus pseudoceratinae]
MRVQSVRRSLMPMKRRGAVLVESAFVANVLFLTLFTMADLAIGVLHSNSLSESARRLARFVAVSGALSEPEQSALGPELYQGNAADDSVIGEQVRRTLTIPDLQNVSVQIEWSDGGNQVGDRIRVSLNYPYQSIIPALVSVDQINLSASSSTTIRH